MKGYKDLLDEEEEEEESDESETDSEDEPEVVTDYKPCLYLNSKQKPEISKYKLGETVTLKFRVKSRTITENKKEGTGSSVELEII